jgi:hypothetical protein
VSGQGNGYDDDVVEDGYVPIGSELSDDYTSLNIEPKPLRPHILAAATIVYGDDYYSGQRETISLSGFVQLNKWPMPGFNHRIDEKGRAMFDLELISAPEVGIKGYSYHLNDRIQVLSNPLLPNTGYVRQAPPPIASRAGRRPLLARASPEGYQPGGKSPRTVGWGASSQPTVPHR